MGCRYATVADQYHGWECKATEGACEFLIPDEKICYEMFGEGPLAFEKMEKEGEE